MDLATAIPTNSVLRGDWILYSDTELANSILLWWNIPCGLL